MFIPAGIKYMRLKKGQRSKENYKALQKNRQKVFDALLTSPRLTDKEKEKVKKNLDPPLRNLLRTHDFLGEMSPKRVKAIPANILASKVFPPTMRSTEILSGGNETLQI